MKILFNENNYEYIEITQANDTIYIVISALDKDNPQKTVINSASLSKDQFFELISDID